MFYPCRQFDMVFTLVGKVWYGFLTKLGWFLHSNATKFSESGAFSCSQPSVRPLIFCYCSLEYLLFWWAHWSRKKIAVSINLKESILCCPREPIFHIISIGPTDLIEDEWEVSCYLNLEFLDKLHWSRKLLGFHGNSQGGSFEQVGGGFHFEWFCTKCYSQRVSWSYL